MKHIKRISGAVTAFLVAMTCSVYADATNIGQNVGEWALSQLWWIALAVVGFMAVRFLIKKAWVPCGIFVVIASLILVLINDPNILLNMGQGFYNMFVN